MHNKFLSFVIIGVLIVLSSCSSEEETNRLREEAYNNGYYDALDCVKRKGGSAYEASEDCEDE